MRRRERGEGSACAAAAAFSNSAASAARSRARRQKKTASAMAARATRPPTTPPTMAPVLEGVGDGAGGKMKLEQAVSGAAPHASPSTVALTTVMIAPGRMFVSASAVDHAAAEVVEAVDTAVDAAASCAAVAVAGTDMVKMKMTAPTGAGLGVICRRRPYSAAGRGASRRRVPGLHWALLVIHDDGVPEKVDESTKAMSSCASVLGLWAVAHATPVVVREMAATV